MTLLPPLCRRRVSRPASVRPAQRGAALRGVVVAAGLVAAVVLQLAGPRLQGRLAELAGGGAVVPALSGASAPPCGSPSPANPMRPCKVAGAATGGAPVI